MTVRLPTISLREFQTLPIIELGTRSPDDYLRLISVAGNSILSSVFVESMDAGATLDIEYFDTTTGSEVTERYDIGNHLQIIPSMLGPQGFTTREAFTKIHDKAFINAKVSGGNVRFGVYVTIVSSFASDLDSALKLENADIDVLRDKGIPITVFDVDTDQWKFLRSTNGRLQVDVPDGIQVSQIIPNIRLGARSASLLPTISINHVDYTVPAGKIFYWISGNGVSSSWTKWEVTIDGVRYLAKRNSFDAPNQDLSVGSTLQLSAGQRIIVTATNIGVFGTTADVESYIFGREVTI